MNLPTKAVKAVITNEQGQILLLQRNPATRSVDNWDLPGGLVEDREDEQTALIREVQEELRVQIVIVESASTWQFLRSKDNQIVKVQNYNCRIKSGEITLSDEHIAYQWVDPKVLRKYPVKDESLYGAIR